jgi:hypothetical protein
MGGEDEPELDGGDKKKMRAVGGVGVWRRSDCERGAWRRLGFWREFQVMVWRRFGAWAGGRHDFGRGRRLLTQDEQ